MKKTVILSFVFCFVLSGCIFDKEEKNYTNLPSNYMNETLTEEMMVYDYALRFPTPYVIEMSPGESKTETITISNKGKKGDTFVFEGEVRRGEENWIDFSTLPEPTYLKSGKEMKLVFTITVPEDAEIGSGLGTSVFASRESNKQIVGSTDFYVKVIEKKSSK